tara:strand:- start:575 stop:808 length:234 start_codon:yes stop_codon:yes gene_type:complete
MRMIMTERERVEGMLIENRLSDLKGIMKTLEAAETAVGHLRDRKWELVEELKELGHDFTATTEGMNVVLSASPSMRF